MLHFQLTILPLSSNGEYNEEILSFLSHFRQGANIKNCNLKVLNLSTTIDRGGAEIQLLAWVKELQKSGCEIVTVPLKGSNELVDEFSSGNLKVDLSLFKKNLLIQHFKFRKMVASSDFDVILLNLYRSEWLNLFANFNKGKIIGIRHSADKFIRLLPNFISSYLARLSTTKQEKTIFISKGLLEWQLERREVSLNANPKIVHYGIKENRRDIHRLKSNSNSSLTIGCAGRLVSGKDVKTLIKAVEEITSSGQKLHLLIAGDGPERRNLEKLVLRLELKPNVKFLGRINDMNNFFDQLDLFVHPSVREGFGLVVLEAMSRGIPVIAADNTSLPELVHSGFNGYLFKTGSFEDLAAKIRSLYDDKLRSEMGTNGMQKARREFSIELSSLNLLSIMQERSFPNINRYK
jgi:glycosyltransferase involved in cell wall biosynthesis